MKRTPVNSDDASSFFERPKKCFEQMMAAIQTAKEKVMKGCASDETLNL